MSSEINIKKALDIIAGKFATDISVVPVGYIKPNGTACGCVSIRYTCENNHDRVQSISDVIGGHYCIQCRRMGRTPRAPVKIPVGTINGDLVVIKDLGVIGGFSIIRVRNSTNGIEKDMTPSSFRRMKTKLLNKDQISEVCRSNGLARKGFKNKKNAKYTFDDLNVKLDQSRLTLMHPILGSSLIYDVISSKWDVRCFCGSVFNPRLNNVMCSRVRSCGCVKSAAQADLSDFIKNLSFNVEVNTRTKIPPYELDIFIPEKNIAIEYCGLYWHGERIKGKPARTRHFEKWKLCKEKGVRLITIFEDEWLNKRPVVEGFLKSILGKQDKKIGARKLQMRVVNPSESKLFLVNHLQGYSRGITIGLWDSEILLAAAVFARPNASRARNDDESVWELSRYCVAPGVQVVGGASKLIAAFKTLHPEAKTLISYSDNRWSEGAMYKTIGFEYKKLNPPSYWYFKEHTSTPRYHRYKFRKSEAIRLFGNVGETEWDINSKNGLDRIWDCGTVRWELNLRVNKKIDIPKDTISFL